MRMSGNVHTTTTTVVLFCFLALVAVTQARPRDCQDAIESCQDRAKDFCDGQYSLWAMKHCRKTCGLCDDDNNDDNDDGRSDNTTTEPEEEEEQELPPIQLASPLSLSSLKLLPQQLSQPSECKDYYAHCHYYINKDYLCNTSSGAKDGKKWAERYCSKYCGFCDDDTVPDNSNPNSNSNATVEDVDTEMSKSDDNNYNENDNVFKQMCEYNGERFEHGMKFNAGCGICDCDDGSISCMDVKCPQFNLPAGVCFWMSPSDKKKCCDEPYCYDGRKIDFPIWWKEQ